MKYVILTGIERSGSSFMVDVLHNHTNVVFLNEPPLEYLSHQPERIMEYLDGYRKRILSGFPVQGVFKAETPELAWDTVGSERGQVESRPFMATYDNENFVFGFKSLAPILRHAYTWHQFKDKIRFIVLVRHPVDTVFSQLKHGGANLPVIPNAEEGVKKITKMIALQQNPLRRAALVWRFNTSLIIDNADLFTIIRYKSLVRHPHEVAKIVLDKLDYGAEKRQMASGSIISHKDEYSVEGRALIASICRKNAERLGVWD